MPQQPENRPVASANDAPGSCKERGETQSNSSAKMLSVWIQGSSGIGPYADPWSPLMANTAPRGSPDAKI
ncbi:hypothetical protein CGCSCA4_v001610 [Colletotrichum siamense]|uniref:Uncharacterized protein n=1 Tax=Colletotrichum siamense TaxID=690259 RepID=A0A9P5K9M9_COLSI|nr:uncharacterized protein CGCS363_v011008 [Colletotrichum siamense]KAF4855259.1 hypothetical protein CGCSCA4_v001610 [Colletotrichum siamense]KAF4865074.1 hypothetical protein CGCSCA2_v001362 [Colletotrichum siamense]KAF5492537.1 hypothetical protein CGCS363_v011008 [Colletotrichum siamense]